MGIFDFLNSYSNKDKKEDEKNAARIQDYINRFKVKSRDITNKAVTGDNMHSSQQYGWGRESVILDNNRPIRYKEYRQMTLVPELAQGLNIYADNATQYNINRNVLEVESENGKIIDILDNLFFEKLDINANLWTYTKNMCELGDEFLEVITDNKKNPHGIVSLKRIRKPENVERIEKNEILMKFLYKTNSDSRNYGSVNQEIKEFQPWQIIHMRILDDEFDPYGKSVFEPGRKVFKRLSLLEDALLVYRITRSPERHVFYIDVGTLSTKDANLYIEQLKRKFRKKTVINPKTGEIDEKANALSITEDFFIAVRQESQGTRIESLPPGANLNEIDDVKYFRDQILRTLGIPAAYLGGSGEGSNLYDSKSFLSQQDIQFSRTIERIQKIVIKALEKIAILELIFNRIDKEEINNFKIHLTPPSNVDQLMEINIRTQQFNLISQIKTIPNFLPDTWIYKNILGFSDEEVNKIKLQIQMDAQLQAQIQALAGGESATSSSGITPTTASISPPVAGGPEEARAGAEEAGGETEVGTETPEGGLEVANKQFVEFDGGKWLMENKNDIKKLLKYIQLYEKVHKDNNKKKIYEHKNSLTQMAIKGEFRGLLTAGRSSNNNKITLIESKKLKTLKKKK